MHFGDRAPDIFEHGPRSEPRGEHEMVSMSFSGPQREPRGLVFTSPTIPPLAFSLPETPPPTQVLIVITMPADTILIFTPPAVSQTNTVALSPVRSTTTNLRLTLPQQIAPSTQNSVSRPPATAKSASLDSLTSFSALFTASSARSDGAAGSYEDAGESTTAPAESKLSETTSADRNSTRSSPATQLAEANAAETDEADELIDLNPADEREKIKRKGTRTAPSTSLLVSGRDEFLRNESQLGALSPVTEPLPGWQRLEVRESFTLPANDDLIELLANDQASIRPESEIRSSLAVLANTQLEATLGLATDVELLDEVASDLAAAIAANSGPLGSLPAAEPK
jgi:hypothetical protein